MDRNSEASGYGESVERLEQLVEALKSELAETQALALKLGELANLRKLRDTADRELIEKQIAMIRMRHNERRIMARTQALATARDRLRYTKRRIAEIKRLGGVPSSKLHDSLAKHRKRVKMIKASDPLNTRLY